jgi:hypothetical protein
MGIEKTSKKKEVRRATEAKGMLCFALRLRDRVMLSVINTLPRNGRMTKKKFEKKAIKATTLDDKDCSSITSNDDDSSDLEKLENRGLIVEFEEESSLEELMTMMGGVTPLTTTRQ